MDLHPSNARPPRRRRQVRWGVLVVLAMLVAGCSSGSGGSGSKDDDGGAEPTSLVGEYELIGDVEGTKVNDGASVTLTLKDDGTLTVLAVQPGETLDDTGTWSVTDTEIELTTTGESLVGEGPFELRGDVLILPFLVFGEGEGRSEWKRLTPPAPPTTEDDDDGQDVADGPPAAFGETWELDGPDAVASAVGMQAYAEAIAEGTAPTDAVQEALGAVQALPSVEDAEVSDNGLNIEITYDDGTTDEVLTERLLDVGADDPSAGAGPGGGNLRAPGLRSGGPGAPGDAPTPLAAGTSAAAPDPSSCATLPASSGDPQEPTREGINPGGGYGVSAYLPTVDAKPIHGDDSPPDDQRTAVLVSPQYDVMHGGTDDADSIRGQAGSNIECIDASLSSRGYDVTTILGKDGDPDSTGLAATARFLDALAERPGVVYFLGHGASGKNKNYLNMGPLDMTSAPVTKVIGERSAPIDRATAAKINESLTEHLGLDWDPNNLVLNISPDSQNVVTLWLHPDVFRALRDERGASFEDSLVWLNACSSAATGTFQEALDAKAFVGWKEDMVGAFIADASEAAFDALTDGTRTARGATQVWQLHALWEHGTGAAESHVDPRNLWAGGETTEYPPLTGQSHILLFFIRHAPGTAVSDLKANADGVKACFDQHWAGGKRAGIGTTCLKLQTGVPTEADVLDAMFEAGADAPGAPGEQAGRWTLAD